MFSYSKAAVERAMKVQEGQDSRRLVPKPDQLKRSGHCPASSILSGRVASLNNVTEDFIEKGYRRWLLVFADLRLCEAPATR